MCSAEAPYFLGFWASIRVAWILLLEVTDPVTHDFCREIDAMTAPIQSIGTSNKGERTRISPRVDYVPHPDRSFGLEIPGNLGSRTQPSRLDRAFDPRAFREQAELAISMVSEHLEDRSLRGLDSKGPDELLRIVRERVGGSGKEERPRKVGRDVEEDEDALRRKLEGILDLYLKSGIQVYSPGYMGRQFSGTVPLAGVVDLVSAIACQPSSFYEAGPLPNVVEEIMAEEFGRLLGWEKDDFAMVTTSGGSLATLTALLSARNHRYSDAWAGGLPTAAGGLRPAIAVSDDIHYSVHRAAGILGIGTDQIVGLPVDGARRICLDQLPGTLDAAAEQGLDVFCLVASAGTTCVGAVDPLDALAEIARERELWLHVDGAHGGSLIVSDALRPRLRGIEKADSFSIDAHKTLFMPAICTLLFYKDAEKSYGAFHQEASYVFEKEPNPLTALDRAKQNFECTKRPMIMNLWVTWTLYGRELFAEKLEYLCDLTEQAHKILVEHPDFETIHRPQTNILCFRYAPDDLPAELAEDFQVSIRNRVREAGHFFMSKVELDGQGAMRVVFMNHEITPNHFRWLLDEIEAHGRELVHEHRIRKSLLETKRAPQRRAS